MPDILLVEDDEMNRDMLSRRLIRKGYQIRIAVDGAEALAAADAARPDLILMDVSLPGISGLEVTRRLRAAGNNRAVPIIALTAHAMPADRDQALAAGCNDYVTKPIDLAYLIERIELLLARAYE